MELQEKILNTFMGKVVRKDLAFQVKGGLPVPTYVLEYLLGQYCATDDQEEIDRGIEKVKEVIQEHYVRRSDDEIVKSRIKERGRYRVIDKVTATLNERDDQYVASFANLGLTNVPIGSNYITSNPKLLSGNGVWCIVTIGYLPGEDIKQRWDIQTLKPVQISNIDLQDYIDKRSQFTTDEWIDFLMHTVGLDPDKMNRREKFITLARLLPHIENNFNFMELGPKGTGKSHVFQELSPYGVLVSGGDVTSPRLFVRMSGRKEELGLVGYWDVVAWDEFEQQKGRNVEAVLIDTMQNYLANKSFNRGKGTHEASASMVFVGNTKHTVPYMLRNSHLFESIPTSFIKGAFLDRIHLYNPGWEIKMLKKDSFTKGYGLISDYLAAVLHALRDRDLTGLLKQYASFDGSLSERDHNAIRKTFSGMVKLLYPDGNMTDDEAYEIIDFATEMRKRVKDQLYFIDETFKAEPAVFRYQKTADKRGQSSSLGLPSESSLGGANPGHEDWINVETLEKVSNTLIQPIDTHDVTESAPEESDEQESITSEQPQTSEQPRLRRPRIQPQLAQGRRSFRLGQTGVTYQDLFADYLKNAKEIVIEDPYIKVHHQLRNLVDFLGMLIDTRPVDGLKVKVITKEHEDLTKHAELIDNFDTIKDDMVGYGIEFDYSFRDFHDRCIKTDDGWTISLGMGLDIYDKADNYTLASARQNCRKCREFSVIYTKE